MDFIQVSPHLDQTLNRVHLITSSYLLDLSPHIGWFSQRAEYLEQCKSVADRVETPQPCAPCPKRAAQQGECPQGGHCGQPPPLCSPRLPIAAHGIKHCPKSWGTCVILPTTSTHPPTHKYPKPSTTSTGGAQPAEVNRCTGGSSEHA